MSQTQCLGNLSPITCRPPGQTTTAPMVLGPGGLRRSEGYKQSETRCTTTPLPPPPFTPFKEYHHRHQRMGDQGSLFTVQTTCARASFVPQVSSTTVHKWPTERGAGIVGWKSKASCRWMGYTLLKKWEKKLSTIIASCFRPGLLKMAQKHFRRKIVNERPGKFA